MKGNPGDNLRAFLCIYFVFVLCYTLVPLFFSFFPFTGTNVAKFINAWIVSEGLILGAEKNCIYGACFLSILHAGEGDLVVYYNFTN